MFVYKKMKTDEVCKTSEKRRSRVLRTLLRCRISKAWFMLLRFRSQIKKIKLSSYWSFGFLLIELRYEMASWTAVAPAGSPGISGR